MNNRAFLKKFSPNAKQAMMSPDTKGPIRILMRITGDVNTQRQSRLQALGCKIHSIAGDIVSTEVPAGVLRKLGELDFINFIEIAQPLYPEKR